MRAGGSEGFLGGGEGGGPEGDGLVQVVNVDDEVADAAAVAHSGWQVLSRTHWA